MSWARNSIQPFLNSDHEQVINLSEGNFIMLALTLIDHMGEAPRMPGMFGGRQLPSFSRTLEDQ